MKSFILIFVLFFSAQSFSEIQVPTGEFEYSGNKIKLIRHTVILYSASSADMTTLDELRAQSYSCKRLSRVFRCRKTVGELPSEIEINRTPEFYTVNFADIYSLEDLVTEAIVTQHLVTQDVSYDGSISESPVYKLYKHQEGATYLDPTLSKLVRFQVLDSRSLTHQNVINKTVSRKESYKIYIENTYLKK